MEIVLVQRYNALATCAFWQKYLQATKLAAAQTHGNTCVTMINQVVPFKLQQIERKLYDYGTYID